MGPVRRVVLMLPRGPALPMPGRPGPVPGRRHGRPKQETRDGAGTAIPRVCRPWTFRLAAGEIEADVADRTRLAPHGHLEEDSVAGGPQRDTLEHRSAYGEQPAERVRQPAAGRHQHMHQNPAGPRDQVPPPPRQPRGPSRPRIAVPDDQILLPLTARAQQRRPGLREDAAGRRPLRRSLHHAATSKPALTAPPRPPRRAPGARCTRRTAGSASMAWRIASGVPSSESSTKTSSQSSPPGRRAARSPRDESLDIGGFAAGRHDN